jgi:hypothetical protein
MVENNEFWKSINQGARNESEPRIGNFPEEGIHDDPTNYEILPIEELRLRADKLSITNFKELNKQELIEAIHNAIKRGKT